MRSKSKKVAAAVAKAQAAAKAAGVQFKPGVSGNPGGKPVGTINSLRGDFVRALATDFKEHGKKAIEDCRQSSPEKYLSVIAAILPKEHHVHKSTDDISDDALEQIVGRLRSELEDAGVLETDGGVAAQTGKKVHRKVSAVH